MKKLILLLLSICSVWTSVSAQSIEPFKDGDRVVFLGNSITDGGHYHSYIWLYYMTRFPDMNLRVVNAGVGGDTAKDMFKRLDADVFNRQPSVLITTFGMNDSGYAEYTQTGAEAFGNRKCKESQENYKLMEARFKVLPNTRMIMLGGSPYDETVKIKDNVPLIGKNAVIKRITEFQRQSAVDNSWEFLDLNEPMTQLNLLNQQKDSTFTLCGSDRIHPDNSGHMVMAYMFLKSQGFVGKPIADVVINASAGGVEKAVNCEISNIKKSAKEISCDYLANSLPYPMDVAPQGWGAKSPQADAVKIVPFTQEMNREMLAVKGLKGKYKLFIDQQEIGVWSADELARGINLAVEAKTPQFQQAQSIMVLNEYRWALERTFREFAWIQFNFFQANGMLFANNVAALELLDQKKGNDGWLNMHREIFSKYMHDDVRKVREQEMELITSTIYEINKPIVRKISLRKL